MTTSKQARLRCLEKEKKRLERAIDAYLLIELNDMVDILSHSIRVIDKEILKLEGA